MSQYLFSKSIINYSFLKLGLHESHSQFKNSLSFEKKFILLKANKDDLKLFVNLLSLHMKGY